MNTPGPLHAVRVFTHEAMNTTFTLRLRGVDSELVGGLAKECFALLDLIEARLSRFIEGSDVSRINQMAAGETLYLSGECHQCLLVALNACVETEGLFDITLGTRIEHLKSGSGDAEPPLAGKLIVHPDIAAITCEEPGREIDLGGIGKGFALDQLKQLLTDWGAEDALLAAGASSLLAFGPQAWPVDLTGDSGVMRIELKNQSLSASGTGIQGSHIIHPWGTEAMPANPVRRIWVTASTAASAEVWSTALMLVELEGIPDFIAGNEELAGVVADRAGAVTVIRC